jgi:hypothetical protein
MLKTMLKTFVAACVLCALPATLWCEPIKYSATFSATGTLTGYDGTTQPFSGEVVFSFSDDTTNVHKVFQDGEFQGYETWASLNIFIEGLAPMKSLLDMELSSERDSMELDGYAGNILLTTFVFSYSGYYNLQTTYKSAGSWIINYFNMGTIPTSKGVLRFSDGSSDGGFAGSLQ